jgi:hypothetical protein
MAGQMPVKAEDIDSIREIIAKAALVDGPPALHAFVALHWPELLHKVKPPKSRMH